MKEAITLHYISTRGLAEHKKSAEAIIEGLAADGGLFVPSEIPKLSLEETQSLVTMSYQERALTIIGKFLTDYSQEELTGCIERAYGANKFDDKQIAPIKNLPDAQVLELWHGPTSAFKDMALQLLPQLLQTALVKTGEQNDILILVATSGDTGKAALAGFCDVPQTKIMVFYPKGGVSRVQQLQMTTQTGSNVKVMAVEGNFDDAQNGVKTIFGDKKFATELAERRVKLSSANSINWGRLVPQIAYYFSAYADMVKSGRIIIGDKINFAVPTGNFGNILAAYYALQMGLPINRLICASNANNVLTDFLRTGKYNRKRPFYKTITPSMDILISSNLERLLYHISGDTDKVSTWMNSLREIGSYSVDEQTLSSIKEIFRADWADDDTTKATIGEVFAKHGYVLDTHSAVAWSVAQKYRLAESTDTSPTVIVSTASPYKFTGSVLDGLGINTNAFDEFQMLDKLHDISNLSVPTGLAGLKNAPQLHRESCERTEMHKAVLNFVAE